MARIKSFDDYSREYDDWYTENYNIYISELNAIRSFIPPGLYGVEIGVGTGRFAVPLGISIGVEPSKKMAEISRNQGINVLDGLAENLPLDDSSFDYVLMVTAICFFDDVEQAFNEAYRVLNETGILIIALIDRKSELGKLYSKHKKKSRFYKDATFYSVNEIINILERTGFKNYEFKQTIFTQENIIQDVETGYGRGSFVIIKATK